LVGPSLSLFTRRAGSGASGITAFGVTSGTAFGTTGGEVVMASPFTSLAVYPASRGRCI
jgi:hypothetical protein